MCNFATIVCVCFLPKAVAVVTKKLRGRHPTLYIVIRITLHCIRTWAVTAEVWLVCPFLVLLNLTDPDDPRQQKKMMEIQMPEFGEL
jgi:hypothetical protein